jgi:hypothetical protein
MTAFDLSLPDSIPDDRYRRRIGLLLGALLGLTYGLFAQVGNRLLVPGIPLYQPPLGAFGNTLLFAASGALMGLLVAWPRSGIKGVFLMAAAAAVGIVLFSLFTAGSMAPSFAMGLLAAVSLSLPFWGLLVPVFAAVRWVIGHQEEAHRDGQSWRGRIVGPLALIVVVALVGYTSVYPSRGRAALQAGHAMLSEAARTGSTPAALANIPAFAANNGSPYQFSWEGGDIGKYRIPRPSRNFDLHSAVIARYAGGWNLVCIYIAADEPPLCRGFDALPR